MSKEDIRLGPEHKSRAEIRMHESDDVYNSGTRRVAITLVILVHSQQQTTATGGWQRQDGQQQEAQKGSARCCRGTRDDEDALCSVG